MSGDFLDTNVLLYLFDETDDRKRGVAEEIVHRSVTMRTGTISHQVVQEALSALFTKQLTPDPPGDARILLDRVLLPLWAVMPTPALFRRALDLQSQYRYSFYDSLIIAAAIEAGCDRLLTEDPQHGQRVEDLTIENPFLA